MLAAAASGGVSGGGGGGAAATAADHVCGTHDVYVTLEKCSVA